MASEPDTDVLRLEYDGAKTLAVVSLTAVLTLNVAFLTNGNPALWISAVLFGCGFVASSAWAGVRYTQLRTVLGENSSGGE